MADVFNSIINMAGTAITIIVILLSTTLAKRFGKKAVAVMGFGLSALNALGFYLLKPTDVYGMLALTIWVLLFTRQRFRSSGPSSPISPITRNGKPAVVSPGLYLLPLASL